MAEGMADMPRKKKHSRKNPNQFFLLRGGTQPEFFRGKPNDPPEAFFQKVRTSGKRRRKQPFRFDVTTQEFEDLSRALLDKSTEGSISEHLGAGWSFASSRHINPVLMSQPWGFWRVAFYAPECVESDTDRILYSVEEWIDAAKAHRSFQCADADIDSET